VTTDDFENPDSSPISPHDRRWRHPAEVADSERSRHLGTSPPLGRRLTALTVIVSVLTSLAVLTVAIPKGIEEYTQAEENESVSTSTIPAVKGSGVASIVGLRGLDEKTTALSLGNRDWLVASESINAGTFAARYGSSFKVLRENKEIGISVIRIKAGERIPAFNTKNIDDQITADELHDCRIIDAFQIHSLASEPSLVSEKKSDSHPINMETSIKGLAVALNKVGNIVAVLVRKGHSQWVVSRSALLALTAR
jgi:hypothetical protein